MPVIDVRLYDTIALLERSGAAKEHIHGIIQGVPPIHWGLGGKPGE